MTEEIKQGMTRREVLKKGAIVGGTMGAVMWVAPVVRAQTVAPGTAAIPSETSCCLKIVSASAFPAVLGNGGLDDFTIEVKVQDCSTHETAYNTSVRVERLPVVSGTPDTSSAEFVDDIPYGDLAPTEEKTNGVNDFDVPPSGDYVYRVHGTYECPAEFGPRLDHNVPSGYWVYTSVVNVP